MNVDGAVFPNGQGTGVGAVIRDSQGKFIGAFVKFFPNCYDPLVIECIAIKAGLHFAFDNGLYINSIESDSLVAITAVNNGRCPVVIDSVIEDIKFLLRELGCRTCRHIPRAGNLVAHRLAHESISFEPCVTWLDECPECIVQQVVTNASLIH